MKVSTLIIMLQACHPDADVVLQKFDKGRKGSVKTHIRSATRIDQRITARTGRMRKPKVVQATMENLAASSVEPLQAVDRHTYLETSKPIHLLVEIM